MTNFEAINHLHINGRGEWFASAHLHDENFPWLEDHAELVKQAIAERRSAAGFHICLPAGIEYLIRRSLVTCIDIETTELTPYSPPLKFTKSTKIGETTWNQYRTLHPECQVNTTPRIRIVAVRIHYRDGGGKLFTDSFAFDLDAFTREKQQCLIDAIRGRSILDRPQHRLRSVLVAQGNLLPSGVRVRLFIAGAAL